MWIITKKTLINCDHCSVFYEDDGGTTAVCNTEEILVSKNRVLSDIQDAILSGFQYLEVE